MKRCGEGAKLRTMRSIVGILALVLSLGSVASAQQTSALPYTFAVATSGQGGEICRGQYVYIITANGQPGNELLYTLDSLGTQPDPNIRMARFLVDGGSIVQWVTNRAEGGGVGLLFVALKDPERAAVATIHVTVNGNTYTNTIDVPASSSSRSCSNPAFYGAPLLK